MTLIKSLRFLGELKRPSESAQKKSRKPFKHVDVTRDIRPMFGLDAMSIVAGSDDEFDGESEDEIDYLEAMTKEEDEPIDIKVDLNVEMPAVSDKRSEISNLTQKSAFYYCAAPMPGSYSVSKTDSFFVSK